MECSQCVIIYLTATIVGGLQQKLPDTFFLQKSENIFRKISPSRCYDVLAEFDVGTFFCPLIPRFSSVRNLMISKRVTVVVLDSGGLSLIKCFAQF